MQKVKPDKRALIKCDDEIKRIVRCSAWVEDVPNGWVDDYVWWNLTPKPKLWDYVHRGLAEPDWNYLVELILLHDPKWKVPAWYPEDPTSIVEPEEEIYL